MTLQNMDSQRKKGDWLVDGKTHYGDGLYEKASNILEQPSNKLEQYASIARRFENLRQRKVSLTWTHHYEVSSLKKTHRPNTGKWKVSDEPDSENTGVFKESEIEPGAKNRHFDNIVEKCRCSERTPGTTNRHFTNIGKK